MLPAELHCTFCHWHGGVGSPGCQPGCGSASLPPASTKDCRRLCMMATAHGHMGRGRGGGHSGGLGEGRNVQARRGGCGKQRWASSWQEVAGCNTSALPSSTPAVVPCMASARHTSTSSSSDSGGGAPATGGTAMLVAAPASAMQSRGTGTLNSEQPQPGQAARRQVGPP